MNIKKLLTKMLTPYGHSINIGDFFAAPGRYGYVTKKGWDDLLSCYLFEIRWSTMTDELIQQVTSHEMKVYLKSKEWRHHSVYPKSRIGSISRIY